MTGILDEECYLLHVHSLINIVLTGVKLEHIH